jgi:integrase
MLLAGHVSIFSPRFILNTSAFEPITQLLPQSGSFHLRPVSSHIGRRSFASNHFGKIPTPIIMAATGHRSESSFLKYIGKSRAEMTRMLAGYWYREQTM